MHKKALFLGSSVNRMAPDSSGASKLLTSMVLFKLNDIFSKLRDVLIPSQLKLSALVQQMLQILELARGKITKQSSAPGNE
jgi:hypothetical protein